MSSLKKKLYKFTDWNFIIEKVENEYFDKVLIIENFGFCEIVGCKIGKKFIRCKEYENCSHNCFYSLYCNKYNIFDLFDNHIPHID